MKYKMVFSNLEEVVKVISHNYETGGWFLSLLASLILPPWRQAGGRGGSMKHC